MRLSIIGATGWLGSALGRFVLETRFVAPGNLVLLNRSGPQLPYHGSSEVIWAADARDLVAKSDVVVLSVRPADWPPLQLDARGRLVVSFMAGVEIDALSASGGRIVRAMPNAASEIRASYTPWFAAPDVSVADKQVVRGLLSCIGTEDELAAERHIDVMTAVPGSGAAYPALMALAMMEFMKSQGVAEPIARRAVEGTVCGGARLLEGRIGEAAGFIAAYRDYKGVTAAGIDTAEAAGFPAAVVKALQAATQTAARMNKSFAPPKKD